MSHSGTPKGGKVPSPRLDSSSSILDAHASNSKQLLNAYIYDFLIKSRLPQTARIFVNEADVPTSQGSLSSNSPGGDSQNGRAAYLQFQKENNLPQLAMAMDAPQGFLFEWWLVFWDVFQAKNNRGSSQMAMQYYQLQMMKQRQQQEMAGMNAQPNMFGMGQTPSQGAQGQLQGQAQGQPQQMDPQQQQRMMMQMMMKQQNLPMMLEQQLQMLGPQLQQQMFLQKQQQQQQSLGGPMPGQQQPQPQPNQTGQHPPMAAGQAQFQPQPQNRIQQHAQNQMNNLRHQAAVAAQQQFQPGEAGSPAAMNRMGQGTPQTHHGQQPMNGMLPYQQPMPQPMPGQNSKANGAHHNGAPGPVMPNGNVPGEIPNGANNGPNRNIDALQDYQMQLMLLEKQNKKRLDIARNNGTSDFSLVSMSNNNNSNMLPPNSANSGTSQKPSPGMAGGSGSPPLTKAASPGNSAAKKKKERPAKRGRKPSTSAPSDSAPTSSQDSGQPNNLKKEYTTPLTPSSEAPIEPAKKKKKGAESPKKLAGSSSKNDKKEKESGSFSGGNSNFETNSNDQMFPILGGHSNNENHIFGSGPNGGGLDDIDFDLNLFLNGGPDSNMHDGIEGFNWGNVDAVEGSEL